MPVEQAGVHQRQDLTSYLLGNLNDQKTKIGDVLGGVKDLYSIGADVYGKVKEQEKLQAAGQEAELQRIGTKDGTQAFDPNYLRARMLINPDIAKTVAAVSRYRNRGSQAVDPADQVDTREFLQSLDPKRNIKNNPAMRDAEKFFGPKVDAAEREVLRSMYSSLTGKNADDEHTRAYAADLGSWAYLTDEGDGQEAPQGQTQPGGGTIQEIGLAPSTQQAQKGTPPLPDGQGMPSNNLLAGANAKAAASQAVGMTEPRGQVASTDRKPLVLGMAPGLSSQTVAAMQGTPAMQQAYQAAPGLLASYLGATPQAVGAAYSGISETDANPDTAGWAKQLRTNLPGIFTAQQSDEDVVTKALALRSGAAHSALSSIVSGKGAVLPTNEEGKPTLYVPNTGGGGALEAPQSGEPNKVAQTGGMIPASYTTTSERPQTGQGGVALGVDSQTLASAQAKQISGQALSPDENLALNNLHKVANAHVKVNGDVLVRGVPLRQLVRDYDKTVPQIENGIRKLNGMGITVEDMMDPTLNTFQGYLSVLKPAQAKFVEQNKDMQALIGATIDWKQSVQGDKRLALEEASQATQKEQFAKELQYKYSYLAAQDKWAAANNVLSNPDSLAAQKLAAQATAQQMTAYNQLQTRFSTVVKNMGGQRKWDEYLKRNAGKTDDPNILLYNSVVEQGKKVFGNVSFDPMSGPINEPSGSTSNPAPAGRAPDGTPLRPDASQAAQTVGTKTQNSDAAVQRALGGIH